MSAAWQSERRSPTNGGGGDAFIPHPAPDTSGSETHASKMGSAVSLIKTLIIPATISLLLYVVISYLLVPLWKRYRARYSNYLPLETLSSQTTSFRQRLQSAIARRLLPSTWRSDFGGNRFAVDATDGSGSDFDDDDGEELYEVDSNRREALSLDARRGRDDDGRRLSRDLEEGFKDDSDDEDDLPDGRRRSISR